MAHRYKIASSRGLSAIAELFVTSVKRAQFCYPFFVFVAYISSFCVCLQDYSKKLQMMSDLNCLNRFGLEIKEKMRFTENLSLCVFRLSKFALFDCSVVVRPYCT